MAVRKTSRSRGTIADRSARKRTPDSVARQFSAIVGAALIGVALLWFAWLLVRQLNPGTLSIVFPLPGTLSQTSANEPTNPLTAAGITLSTPEQGQKPLLTQQQALLLANQAEPQVAVHAHGVDAVYTLFSYKDSNSTSSSWQDVPTWLVHYTGVEEPQPDTAADPQATHRSHDLYIFLDASSGQELLAIWL